MSQDIRDFVTPSCDLLALGEPTHMEPAFPRIRNELFAQLVDHGFRSIALETDRVPALALNDYVREGVGSFDEVMSEGIAHGRGELAPNRQLITWMREYNRDRPAGERLSFYGFDAEMENMSAPSPRRYLEHARAYLGNEGGLALSAASAASAVDIASLAGDDERWSRTEAVLDPAMSIGATAEAETLRSLADDMLTEFHARAPELIAATSRAEWFRARAHLTAGLGLLRYHRQLAQPIEESVRISRLLATRDALMVQNLLDIRDIEAGRGPTLVFGHNLHLQRNLSHMRMRDLDLNWYGAGAILGPLVGERYAFIAGSPGREGAVQDRTTTWVLAQAPEPTSADGVLHLNADD